MMRDLFRSTGHLTWSIFTLACLILPLMTGAASGPPDLVWPGPHQVRDGGSLGVQVVNVQPVSCFGLADGSAEAIVTGGTPPFTFQWDSSPTQGAPVLSGVGTGTYTVTVGDADGSTVSASITIVGPAAPLSVSVPTSSDVPCGTTGTGSATAAAAGGTPPYTYEWNTPIPQTGPTATGLDPGTYTVTATDANGCTTTSSVTLITVTTPILGIVEDYNHVSCFGANDGSITLLVSGASNSFTITWNTVPPVSGPTITGLAPGTYEATVVDNFGCDTPKFIPFEILGPSIPLAVDLDISPTTCANTLDGAVDLTISGGNAPYSQLWSDPLTGQSTDLQDLSGLDPGTYLLLVTDAFGCELDTFVTILTPPAITIDLETEEITCAPGSTGSITATVQGGTGALALQWTGPDGFSSSTAAITDLPPGVFTITVSDANGCEAEASVTLATPPPPTLSITTSTTPSGDEITCAGGDDGSIDLTIAGGPAPFTIEWTDGLGTTATSEDLTGLTAGNYLVTVTDANNCQASTSVTLTAPPSIDLSAVIATIGAYNTSCPDAADGFIDLTIGGGAPPYTTTWSTGGTSEDVTAIAAGSYEVAVTDANGCTASTTYTLTAPPLIVLDIDLLTFTGGANVSCPDALDGEITATANGGAGAISLQWSGPLGAFPPGGTIQGLGAGSYSLLATDTNGCIADTTVVLIAPSPVVVNLTSPLVGGTNIACAGGSNGSINSTVSGGVPGYTYAWTGPGGILPNTPDHQDLEAGTYDVIVTDAFGCTGTGMIILNEPDTLEVSFDVTDFGGFGTSCTADDGAITTLISGGTPAAVIAWSGPNGFTSDQVVLADLVAGTYIATVTDANGCATQGVVTLDPAPPVFVDLATTPGICHGDDQGSIASTVSGGTSPIQYDWSGPGAFTATTADVSNVIDGTYVLTVTDSLGCTATATTTLQGPEPLQPSVTPSSYGIYNTRCIGDSSGTLTWDVASGTAPYSATLTGPVGTITGMGTFTGLTAGSYTIAITDANGCTIDANITLSGPDSAISSGLEAAIQAGGTNISCQGGSDGSIDATVSGGVPPFTFAWSGPAGFSATTEDITGLPSGGAPYVLQITDMNQCVRTDSITLTEPTEPLGASGIISDFGSFAISCPGASDGSIDLNVTGGTPGYVVSWSGPGMNGTQTEDLTGIPAGSYTAQVTDLNGCGASITFVLEGPQPIDISIDISTYPGGSTISCAGAADGGLNAIWTGGSSPVTATWTAPGGATFTTPGIADLGPGTYCLQLVDGQGCTADSCVTITEPAPVAVSASTTAADCGAANGAIDLTTTGGSTPYAYTWSNGSTSQDLAAIVAGPYTVTVADANGCTAGLTTTVPGSPSVQVNGSVTDALCAQVANGSVDITTLTGTSPFQYAWSNGSTSEDLGGVGPGIYTITVTDGNGCEAEASFTVSAPSPLSLTTTLSSYLGGYNVSSWQGQDGSIVTDVSGGTPPYTYGWSSGAATADLIGVPAGEFTLVVTDANGCSATVTVTLTQPSDLMMPTGFTPNGDGSNDVFFIRGLDSFPANRLVIVNRWGNRVFERLNYRNDWDGESIQGGPLPNGTYFAILEVNDGARTLQGYVDLRR